MSNELNPYVRALVIQLINDNIAEGKEEFPLVIPVDYKERVYNQRELVKKLISSLGYLYSESGLPDDWANGWELTSNRHLQDPTDIIPDDMLTPVLMLLYQTHWLCLCLLLLHHSMFFHFVVVRLFSVGRRSL